MYHAIRSAIVIPALVLTAISAAGAAPNAVVADSLTRRPLPGASVFDSRGNVVGICDANGVMPRLSPASYPLTVRCLGFSEAVVTANSTDTIFLGEYSTELPEMVVESRNHKVLHMLAYVREYSTLSTFTDTVFLFREKMVDYMVVPDRKSRFKGWNNPRILKSRSYYRFTDSHGLDSVSDASNHHFSWSDWVGLPPESALPRRMADGLVSSDTLRGKYSPAVMWSRNDSRVSVDINVVADTAGRRWVPGIAGFMGGDIDFERFNVRFNYDTSEPSLRPSSLTGYSFSIESNYRGHNMFMFNRVGEPFYVSTYAEIYVLDKEFITVREARRWDRRKFDADLLDIYIPEEAPELQPQIIALIDRVNTFDKEAAQLALTPDHRLAGRPAPRRGFGFRLLQLVKNMTGISSYKSKRKLERDWKEFRKGCRRH